MNKGLETRNTILNKALALASASGLEGLSIGALAKEVGLSKSGLFGHFDSKQNLQLQVIEAAVELFIARVIAPSLREPRGVSRLRALFENWLMWERDPALPGGCLFISAANELDDRPGPVRDLLVAYQRDWIEVLAGAATIAVAEGELRADLDSEQFAYDFYSIALAYHHFSRLLRDRGALDRARRAFEHLLRSSETG